MLTSHYPTISLCFSPLEPTAAAPMTGQQPAPSAATCKSITLACTNCGFESSFDNFTGSCPSCGETLLEARYDYDSVDIDQWLRDIQRRPNNLWRYHEWLPIHDPANIVTLHEGGTPLIRAQALAAELGLKHLYIKDERQGPTGSFKDRQATVAISALKEMGIDDVVVASTGNVAIAYAAYGARAGIHLWAFFPELAPNEKIREAALYGAEIIKTTGNYDQTKALAANFARAKNIFLDRGIKSIASTEAMKTMAYEFTEQLGYIYDDGRRWRSPDWFLQGVSGGLGPIGVAKGLRELRDFGLIDHLPAFGMIQSSGCAPMVEAYRRGQRVATPVEQIDTIIATLATGRPGRAYEVLYDYVIENGGDFISASDEEAFQAIRLLARLEGISVEPATGVTFAGLFKMVQHGIIRSDEIVVVNCSGHTLPVETSILGDRWHREFDLSQQPAAPPVPEQGLMDAIDHLPNHHQLHRVVVIEDNEGAARLISRLLQSRNCEVYIAQDGARGLSLVESIRPDLVITDLMMPGIDGFAVIRHIRQMPGMETMPVVVVTAKELTVEERREIRENANLLLQKGSFIDDDVVEKLISSLE